MPANRPTPAELLVAIREFLEQDIKALVAGGATAEHHAVEDVATKSLALNNAIAINMVKLLERESQMRNQQLTQEHTLLRELLVCRDAGDDIGDDLEALNEALIELIETHDFIDSDLRVLRVLQQISLSKLAIDNPSYSTLRKHRR